MEEGIKGRGKTKPKWQGFAVQVLGKDLQKEQ
jgi:hypothetical protein